MSTTSPFDHRQDSELGDALRSALSADDDAQFAQRVVAASEAVFVGPGVPEQWWNVLTAWARPGLVAALVLVAAAAFWLGAWVNRDTSGPAANGTMLGDPLLADSDQLAVPVLLAGQSAPNMDEVLAVALGN
ncbi:MAG: hypothetical protein GTN62_04740 [Gemmatimonadales bacterium]|nr:hypothetical protein [Gemmatimonadales bacterium]NIN10645.1 hypothetical protein [Gemmatimonadales bacterium]NIN49407.1 hypothetical protein [Gemmatimonadales bacterium]NIP06871.1 hypothetical protein [Gemmatimonadales bacterium]NIR01545.1 hypothetical protein [Gemmatimonadales bacterium]